MSLKSIIFSILTVLLFYGLLAVTVFILFSIFWLLGIVGIVVTLAVTSAFGRKAIVSSDGIIDGLVAKIIVPVLILVGLAAILLFNFL